MPIVGVWGLTLIGACCLSLTLAPRTTREALGPDSLVVETTLVLPSRPSRWALHLPPLRFQPRLTVNGQDVPLPGDDFLPRKVDLTPYLQPGANTFRLVVHSWTSRLIQPPAWLDTASPWFLPRQRLRDRAWAPIGGHYDRYGLWGTIRLTEHPGPFLLDVDVWTFFPDSLVVQATLPDTATVHFRILDHRRVLWEASARGVSPRVRWPSPNLEPWWPHRPRLYTLEVQAPGETARVAIGWRGFQARGDGLWLNGQRIVLCGTSFWPPYPTPPPDTIRALLQRVRAMNTYFFRTHTRPWDTLYYALADTLGLLVIPEGALFNDDRLYRLDDPRLDQAVRKHHAALVHALGHHPSVVMWSLGNELWGPRSRQRRYEVLFGSWLDHARRLDPTRPVFFEGDGDPDGRSDVIGIHYPLPWPRALPWPMAAYFLHAPIPVRRWFWPDRSFQWDRRKPLYVGEFLWWPSPTPHPYTTVIGDSAFTSGGRLKAKARAWSWQILAYRHFRVPGFAPWSVHGDGASIFEDSPLYLAQKDACKPVRLAFRRPRRTAPNGVYRDTLEVFHDTFHPGTLRVLVRSATHTLLDTTLLAPPFTHTDLPLSFRFTADLPRRETLRATLSRNGQIEDTRTVTADILPLLSAPPAPDVRHAGREPSPWGPPLPAPISLVFPQVPHPLNTAFPPDFFSLWGGDGISADGFLTPPPSASVLPLLGGGSPRGIRPVAVVVYRPPRGFRIWHTLRIDTPEGRVWLDRIRAILDTLSPPRGVQVMPDLADLSGVIALPPGSGVVWLRPHPERTHRIRALRSRVRQGLRVWIERPQPEEAAVLGLHLRRVPGGIHVEDLASTPYARWLHREHLMPHTPPRGPRQRSRRIPVAYAKVDGGIPLTHPPVITAVPEGRGMWVVSTLVTPGDVPALQQVYLDLLRMLVWMP